MAERSRGGTSTKASGRAHAREKPDEVSVWEWVAAGVSALVVTGVIVSLFYQELTSPDSPPLVVVTASGIVELERGYLVEFVARNEGHSTAAEVEIEGRLERTAGGVEIATVVLDFVPARATRRGGLYFDSDPRAGTLTLDAGGYREP